MNKHIITLIIALAAVCGGVSAQQNQGEVIPSVKTRLGLKQKQVGTSIMHVDYAMNADSIGQEKTYIDLQRLEIGRDCAKHSSLFLKHFVGSTRPTKDGQAIMRGGKPGKQNAYWNDIQFTDLFLRTDRSSNTPTCRCATKATTASSPSRAQPNSGNCTIKRITRQAI